MNSNRSQMAKAAIVAMFEANGDDNPVWLFISHHIDEFDSAYWEQHLGTAEPDPRQVLEILIPLAIDDTQDNEDAELLDYSLPDDATQYLICVTFDEDGNVEDIAMES